MPTLSYRPYKSSDRNAVLNLKLRTADLQEVQASAGLPPAEAIEISLQRSSFSWVILLEEEIVGVFGLGIVKEVGFPWLLATDALERYHRQFARGSREVVVMFQEHTDTLINYVDSRNTTSQRWLEWLGFTVWKDLPQYLYDKTIPFYPFTLYKQGGMSDVRLS